MPAANSNPAEIDRFSAMADVWWDVTGPCKPLHELNPARYAFIRQHVPVLSQQRVVDIGCGGGVLSEVLAREGALVTGIDRSDALISVAGLHAQQHGLDIDYLVTDAETLSTQRRGYFDVVCCMELLEHVPDFGRLVQAASDLAKPGGWLFFSTINRSVYAYLLAIIGAEYITQILPRGTHQYHQFIRPSEFAAAARKAGLSLRKLRGVHYNPFTSAATLDCSVSVQYIAALEKRA